MNIKYVFANPTHNYTVLVTSPVPETEYAKVSGLIFDMVPLTEQVGFLSLSQAVKSEYRLDMMGGEFCGNAVLSVAALVGRDYELKSGESKNFNIDASGSYLPINCSVTAREKDYICSAVIPAPLKIETVEDYPVVHLSGISYLIADSNDAKIVNNVDRYVRHFGNMFDVPAFGILIWDSLKQFMHPVVFVKATNTVVHENGCGSGSAALGSYITYQNKKTTTVDINQPGGTITVTARSTGLKILDVTIKSPVSLKELQVLEI